MASRLGAMSVVALAILAIALFYSGRDVKRAGRPVENIRIVQAPSDMHAVDAAAIIPANDLETTISSNNEPFKSEEYRIKASLFRDSETANFISVICNRDYCDIFPSGEEKGAYPRAVALVIAINSGLKDSEIQRLGFNVVKQGFFARGPDRRLRVSLQRR